MARYIDAELIKYGTYEYAPYQKIDIVTKDSIDRIPTADVQEIKHGHWIEHKADLCGGRGCNTKECSVCHAEQRYLLDDNYCPNCGTIMDKGGAE